MTATPGHAALSAARAALMAELDAPMLTGPLPATVELRPAAPARRWARMALGGAALSGAVLLAFAWNEGLLDRAEGEPFADYLGHLLDLAQSAWLLVPGLCLAAAAAFAALGRRRPDRVRITLSQDGAKVEGPGGTWDIPMAEFTAVALRMRPGTAIHMTSQETNLHRGILAGQRYAVLQREALWWWSWSIPTPSARCRSGRPARRTAGPAAGAPRRGSHSGSACRRRSGRGLPTTREVAEGDRAPR